MKEDREYEDAPAAGGVAAAAPVAAAQRADAGDADGAPAADNGGPDSSRGTGATEDDAAADADDPAGEKDADTEARTGQAAGEKDADDAPGGDAAGEKGAGEAVGENAAGSDGSSEAVGKMRDGGEGDAGGADGDTGAAADEDGANSEDDAGDDVGGSEDGPFSPAEAEEGKAGALEYRLIAIDPPVEPAAPLPQFAELAQARPVHVRLRRPTTVDVRRDRRLKWVIAGLAVSVALVFAVGSVALASLGSAQAAATLLPAKVPMLVGVDAPGLDVATGSRIPLQVVGVTQDGDSVDQVAFVDQAGGGLSVEPGTYEISVAGSPIAADGTVYSVPDTVVAVDVPAVASAQLEADPFKLEPLAPQDTTEEDVSDAYRYAVQGGCNVERAPELKVAAEQRAGLS